MNEFQQDLMNVDFEILIPNFSKDDFLETTKPYEYVYNFIDDSFQHERALSKMADEAVTTHKIRNFRTLYKSFVASKKKISFGTNENVTRFTGVEEYFSGNWRADDDGVYCFDQYGVEQCACTHPIYIKKRLFNIDDQSVKVELSFCRSKRWRSLVIDKETISSANKIVKLSLSDVSVTSESSKLLVQYLNDFENLNYLRIPELTCTSRMGWMSEGEFAPYVDNLIYDGDGGVSSLFNSITQKGSIEKWKEAIIEARNKNHVNKIIVATSFASALIKHLGINNFMLHIWGTSEFGKTVACMMAASVWANPDVGKYIQTFNSTLVGREFAAGFLNNLPLILDELMIVDKKQFDEDIYKLCEGAGKLRGNKYGGTNKTLTWENTIISNGEKPILSTNSLTGASNRIIEIECHDPLFDNGRSFCSIIRNNYGIAGKLFIEKLNLEELKAIFEDYLKDVSQRKKTSKQAASASAILATDYLICKQFFNNNQILTIEEIEQYLLDAKQISQNAKAYNFICNWVVQNSNKFIETGTEIYGVFDDNKESVYIINNIFNSVCESESFNYKALLSYLKTNNLINSETSTVTRRINGIVTRCVHLKISEAIIIFN